MKKVRCPYCGSSNVEEVDIIGRDVWAEHLSYTCNFEECGENFYAINTLDIVKVEVSKEKYKNYITTYEK